jgi:hypothetical protein
MSKMKILSKIDSFSSNSLDAMQADMFSMHHPLQILDSVVRPIAVLVMHMFTSKKISTKLFFDNESVFGDITTSICIWMFSHLNQNVSRTTFLSSTFPTWIVFSKPSDSFLESGSLTTMICFVRFTSTPTIEFGDNFTTSTRAFTLYAHNKSKGGPSILP